MGASGDVGDRRPDAAGRARRLGTPGRTTGQQTRTRPRAVRPWLAEDQRNLNAACQWLWRPGAAVEWAHRQDPVLADDVRLLHAIPSGALEPRRLPPDPKRSLNCARERPAAPSESAEPRKAPAPTQPGPRSSAQSHSASPRPAPPSSAITA